MIVEHEKKINYLFLITILFLALFSNIRYHTGFAVIRLFDILTIIFFIYIFNKEKNNNDKTFGFYYLIPFFAIHVLLSYQLGVMNVLRELSQIIVIVLFLNILNKSKNEINFIHLLKNLFWVFILILLFVIMWHLNKGIFAGWKSFPDSRIVYSLITILFFIFRIILS